VQVSLCKSRSPKRDSASLGGRKPDTIEFAKLEPGPTLPLGDYASQEKLRAFCILRPTLSFSRFGDCSAVLGLKSLR
jgi:hypothetical protein